MKKGQESSNKSTKIGSFNESFKKTFPHEINFTFVHKVQNGQKGQKEAIKHQNFTGSRRGQENGPNGTGQLD